MRKARESKAWAAIETSRVFFKPGRLSIVKRSLRKTTTGQVFCKLFLRRKVRSPKHPALFALSRSTRSRDSRPMAGESSSGRPSGVARKRFAVCGWDSSHCGLEKISARLRKIRLRPNRIPLMSALPAAKGLRSLKAKAGFSSLVPPVMERDRERKNQNENFQCPPSTSSSKKDARRSR